MLRPPGGVCEAARKVLGSSELRGRHSGRDRASTGRVGRLYREHLFRQPRPPSGAGRLLVSVFLVCTPGGDVSLRC